jgi:hypothetical protein
LAPPFLKVDKGFGSTFQKLILNSFGSTFLKGGYKGG